MFYLAEYMHMITISAVGVTLFLGGWHGPRFHVVPWLWPLLWFLVKLFVVIFALVWIRATLPRFRYDRLMSFGWKVLIPVGLLWILVTAAYVELPKVYPPWRAALIIVAAVIAILILLGPLFVGPPRGMESGLPSSPGQRVDQTGDGRGERDAETVARRG